MSNSFYLSYDQRDELFGITVTTVGVQAIHPQMPYPPVSNHPKGYLFNPLEGRVLNEYQLLYITEGKGVLEIEPLGEFPISEGKMFLLFPGVRHRYRPLEKTGWNEYWIGFRGKMIEEVVEKGFFSKAGPILNLGMNERIVDLYLKAIGIAREGRAGCQQALAGIVYHMLGLAYYRDRNTDFHNEEAVMKINKAKLLMREGIYDRLQVEDLAEKLHLSYSYFRKTFKDIEGVSPLYYFQVLRVQEAKLLLTTTSKTIKEISFDLNFESPEYFSVFFKKHTGKTPGDYRSKGICRNG